MKQTIIHARISQETQSEIDFLKEDLELDQTTAVIEFALHQLATERRKIHSKINPFDFLEDAALIGKYSLPEELSSTYKKTLKSKLIKKHKPKGSVHEK